MGSLIYKLGLTTRTFQKRVSVQPRLNGDEAPVHFALAAPGRRRRVLAAGRQRGAEPRQRVVQLSRHFHHGEEIIWALSITISIGNFLHIG